jgi:hypothetical protein
MPSKRLSKIVGVKRLITLFTIFLIITSLSNCASTINSESIEKHNTGLIGQKYESVYYYNWHKINESADTFEVEYTLTKDCSYALTINNRTSLIESWRFTSDKSNCNDIHVFP